LPSVISYDDGAGVIGLRVVGDAPFCGDCNRARLFVRRACSTLPLRDARPRPARPAARRRQDEELLASLRQAWSQRADRYSELRDELRAREVPLRKIEMHHIGRMSKRMPELSHVDEQGPAAHGGRRRETDHAPYGHGGVPACVFPPRWRRYCEARDLPRRKARVPDRHHRRCHAAKRTHELNSVLSSARLEQCDVRMP
jgi:hypothetical protein